MEGILSDIGITILAKVPSRAGSEVNGNPSRSGAQSCSGGLTRTLVPCSGPIFSGGSNFLGRPSELGNRGTQKNTWALRSASMEALGAYL